MVSRDQQRAQGFVERIQHHLQTGCEDFSHLEWVATTCGKEVVSLVLTPVVLLLLVPWITRTVTLTTFSSLFFFADKPPFVYICGTVGRQACDGAAVVVTATVATEPVVLGSWLSPATCILSVGEHLGGISFHVPAAGFSISSRHVSVFLAFLQEPVDHIGGNWTMLSWNE